MRHITRLRTLSVAVLTVAVAASCAVATPARGETVPLRWGNPPIAHRDVAYGPHAAHRGDVYLPTKGGNRGVIVVHGGAFVEGDRRDIANLFGPVLRQTHRGFAVFNISYRLTTPTSNQFPAATNDLSTAVNWVRAHGARHGMNPRTVIVAGHSAGGTIAALVGVGSNANPSGPLGRTAKVDGWVSFAGMYDFVESGGMPRLIGNEWLGANANKAPRRAAASVTRHLDRNDPPGFVVHGDRDNLVPIGQMHTLLAAAANAGVSGRLFYDTVNTGGCRHHQPMCGMNSSTFDYWTDQVAARNL